MRSNLHKKVIRDMKKSLGAYLVCVLVVAIGIIGFCSIAIAKENLTSGRDDFYARTNFADGFASVVKAPLYMADVLADLPGVKSVSGRIVKTCRIVSYGDEEVDMTLVSLSDSGVNQPELLRGVLPVKGEYGILIGQAFYDARGLKEGDTLEFAINGIRQYLTVTGCGQSPEYVYIMKNPQDMIPNPFAYGIGFLPYGTMAAVYNFSGCANDFTFVMENGAKFSDIEDDVKDLLSPYGVVSVYGRKDQLSNSMLQGELDQLDRMESVMPVLFLSVAAIIIYIMLRRLIQQQRSQIGVLMGFGFSNFAIMRHYIYYGAVVGFLGGTVGGILGSGLGSVFMDMYRDFFQIPGLSSQFSFKYLWISILMSTVFCAFAAYRAAHSVMQIHPAEAMRPESPKETRSSFFEKIPMVMNLFNSQGRMSVRSLFRNRKRSLMTVIVITLAFNIMASLLSMNTLMDDFIFDNLRDVQKQDIRISFAQPVKIDDALRAASVGNVELAEPMTEVGVNIRSRTNNKDASILALPEDPQLYKILDINNNVVRLPDEGIVLAEHLAGTLGVKIGDTVELEIGYPKKIKSRVKVTDLVPQYIGANAYMSFSALAKISDYDYVATAVNIKGGNLDEITKKLEDTGSVTTVENREKTIERYAKFIDSYGFLIFVMALMGVVIGFAVIYTSSIISFEETKRDIAILRILGLSARETLEVISVEKWLLTAAGIVIGLPLTRLTSEWVAIKSSTDVFSVPAIVSGPAVIQSVILTLLAVWLSNRVIFRSIRKVAPADVLKDRE